MFEIYLFYSIPPVKRFSWEELFFYRLYGTPLPREKVQKFEKCFEAVRQAPSGYYCIFPFFEFLV